MNRWQQFKNWVSSLASVGGIEIPPDGRSSTDEALAGRINNFLAAYSELAPGLSFESLAALKYLYIFNPDFSQAVGNFVALANTGHQITISTGGVRVAQAAIARLNEAAKRIYPNSDGVDGLIRDQITQVCWSGTVSREDEIDITGRRVKRVLLVPPEEIRFWPIEGEWQAHQMPKNGWLNTSVTDFAKGLPLSALTYRYLALERVDNSPYAKPPFSAALDAILKTQDPMLASLRQAAEKLGFLGLYTAEVRPPAWDRSKETWEEYQAKGQRLLKAVRDSFEAAAKSGKLKNLIATFNDQKVSVTPTTGDARGAAELFNLNEEQVASGLRTMPAFLGRNFTTTETFADVVYYLYVSQALNIQGLVKRSVERTYELDLALGGVQVNGLSVSFNPIKSRNELQEAQADHQRLQTILSEIEAGFISPDQGAQKRGYEKAFDAERLNGAPEQGGAGLSAELGQRAAGLVVELRWNPAARAYVYLPPRIEVNTAGGLAGNLVDFGLAKKKVRLMRSS